MEILFVFGPLNGQRLPDPGLRRLAYQLPDPHTNLTLPQRDPSEGCLELREIEALTGRTGHRRFGIIGEDLERRSVLMRFYERRAFICKSKRIWLYVWEGATDEEVIRMLESIERRP